jgi:hypothetical protein
MSDAEGSRGKGPAVSDEEKKDDSKVVSIKEAKAGTAAAAKKNTPPKGPADDGEDEFAKPAKPDPPSAGRITEIIEGNLKTLKWQVNAIRGIISPIRQQQDGKFTIDAATKELFFFRQGFPLQLNDVQIQGALRRIISDKRADVWFHAKKRHGKKAKPETLASGLSNFFIEEFLRALLHPDVVADVGRFENCVIVMRQWIWNIKQRLMGRPDKNHIVPALHGKGGSGKSTLIRNMIKQLFDDLADDINLSCYDPNCFNKDVLSQLLVGLADEACGESSVMDGDLKNGITSPIVLGRNMWSQQAPQPERNMSLIICRNGAGQWEKIHGDRRIYNMRCTDDKAQDNKAALDEAKGIIDDMFDSVFYNEPEPILPRLSLIRLEQETTDVNEGFMSMWLTNCTTRCEKGTSVDHPWETVKASLLIYGRHTTTPKREIPIKKLDIKQALKDAGAVTTTPQGYLRLVSHQIKPAWLQ